MDLHNRHVIAAVHANALYVREQSKERKGQSRIASGYLKLNVSFLRRENGRARFVEHPRFHHLYLPFHEGNRKSNDYHLSNGCHGDSADIVVSRRFFWQETRYGLPKGRYELPKGRYELLQLQSPDKDLYQAVVRRAEDSLERIIGKCQPLARKSERERRSFLAHYPREFWEKKPLRSLYGFMTTKKLEISIAEEDLHSYKDRESTGTVEKENEERKSEVRRHYSPYHSMPWWEW